MRGSVYVLGIIIRARGTYSVCIISLITLPCSNYSTAGTHWALRSLPVLDHSIGLLLSITQRKRREKVCLVLKIRSDPCSPYSCHSSPPSSSSALPWLRHISRKLLWKFSYLFWHMNNCVSHETLFTTTKTPFWLMQNSGRGANPIHNCLRMCNADKMLMVNQSFLEEKLTMEHPLFVTFCWFLFQESVFTKKRRAKTFFLSCTANTKTPGL